MGEEIRQDSLENRLVRWTTDGLQIREDAEGGGPGILYGPVVVYGDTAKVFDFTETVAPSAFGDFSSNKNIIANYMHDRRQPLGRVDGGGLELKDSNKALTAELTLPDTVIGRDTATLVRDKILRGFSLEFYMKRWEIDQKKRTLRHIEAILAGFGVVDIPAYGKSVPALRWSEIEQMAQLENILTRGAEDDSWLWM